jgi:hypothetical protein
MTEGEGSIREQESKKRGGEEGTTTNNKSTAFHLRTCYTAPAWKDGERSDGRWL